MSTAAAHILDIYVTMREEITQLRRQKAAMLEALQTIEDRCGASGNNKHDKLVWTIAHTAIRQAKGE